MSHLIINSLAKVMSYVGSVLKSLQVKQFLSVALVGFFLLTSNPVAGQNRSSVADKVDTAIHRNDSDRPKTTGEWKQEARETEGAPLERLQRIADQTGEAIKEWGGLYPDTAERSADQLDNSTNTVRR